MYGCFMCNKVGNLKHQQQLYRDSVMDQESVTAELKYVNDHESVEESAND